MKKKPRPAVAFLGVLFVIAAGLFLVEWLVVPDVEPVPIDRPDPPTPPTVRKTDDDTVEILFGGRVDSTIRIEGETEVDLDQVVDCIQEGIEDLFSREVPARGRRLKRAVSRVQQDCIVGPLDK